MPNNAELLDLLLNNRGILPEHREKFLNPLYEHLYDPYALKDMDKAVERIFQAIENKEKIVIYSDYDCDGIPASVIMYDFFNKINYENFSIYIPHRHDEGYGLHLEAIKNFIKDEVKLLITFDLGITAINEVTEANKGGIDVIITDHHLPRRSESEGGLVSDILPSAYAIINSKQEFCEYPEKMLCGAGVAFKLIQALILRYGDHWKINKGWEKWLLDMVGVATLSDQVPLLNENRILAYYGLKVLQKGRRLGLTEIFRKGYVDISNLNEEDITFTLAPRINAASRMADPMIAFNTLSTKDQVLARAYADQLSKINDDRKLSVAHIMKEIKKILSKREIKEIIVIGNPAWKIGVLGIVASKIVEEYKRPVFVWGGGDGNDLLRGSCRSYGSINLVDIMQSLPEKSIMTYGGHSGAGGFSVSHEEVHFLEDRLINVFKEKNISETIKENPIDATISLDDINHSNYKVIESLAPYGVGNPKPTFLIKGAIISDVKEFGKEKNHLELSFLNSKGKSIKAIAFFKTRKSFGDKVKIKEMIDLVGTFEKSTFLGRTELRLRIVDIV